MDYIVIPKSCFEDLLTLQREINADDGIENETFDAMGDIIKYSDINDKLDENNGTDDLTENETTPEAADRSPKENGDYKTGASSKEGKFFSRDNKASIKRREFATRLRRITDRISQLSTDVSFSLFDINKCLTEYTINNTISKNKSIYSKYLFSPEDSDSISYRILKN